MILLKHISAEHFMSINSVDLTFDDNCMVAITGENGIGKSTLIYLVAFCLTEYKYGETYKDYVQTGYDSCQIQLDAEFKGFPISYEIEITGASKKTGSASIFRRVTYKDQEYINSEYDQFIVDNGLDYLESLMFLFQSSNSLINARPAERATALRRLFNFDFSTTVDALRNEQEGNKIATIESTALLEELKSRNYDIQPLYREIPTAAVNQLKQDLAKVNESLNGLANVTDDSLNALAVKLSRIRQSISVTADRISSDTQQITNTENKLAEIETFLAENSTDKLNKDLEKAKQDLKEHKEAFLAAQQRVAALSNDLNLKNYEIKELIEQIKISKEGICHACGQTIEESHVQKLEAKKDKFEQEADLLRQELVKENIDPRDPESQRMLTLIQDLEKLIARVSTETANQEIYQDKLQTLEESIKDKKNYLSSLQEELSNTQAEQEAQMSLSSDLQQKAALEAKKQSLEEQIENAQRISITNAERRKTNAALLQEKQARDQKVAELSTKINDLALATSENKAIIDIFEKQFPNYLVLRAAQLLQDHINLIIQRIFPYMSVKLVQQKGGVNFFYKIKEEEDYWLSIRMASGAQKQILTLAYSISLAKLFGLDCIMLDEIDASMSPENAAVIYDFVAGLDCFKQTFFISHRAEAVQAARDINPNLVAYNVGEGGQYNLV